MSKRNDVLKLTVAQETFAVEAINAYASLYGKQKSSIGKMSGHILGIARQAMADAEGETLKAQNLYKEMCKHAETVYKQAHEDKPIALLLPFWQPCKSACLRAMRAEIDPRDHDTANSLIEAGAAVPVARAPKVKGSTVTISKILGTALESLYGTVGTLNEENQARAAELVHEITVKCNQMFRDQTGLDVSEAAAAA